MQMKVDKTRVCQSQSALLTYVVIAELASLASDAGVEVAGGVGGGARPGHGGGHLPQLQAAEERREGQQGTLLTLSTLRLSSQPQQVCQEEEEEKVYFLECQRTFVKFHSARRRPLQAFSLLKAHSGYCETMRRFVDSFAPNTLLKH